MSLLDRYIARQYLFNVLALIVILFSFIVTVDVALNVDRFIGAAEQLSTADGEDVSPVRKAVITVLVIADLWWPRLLQLYNFMLGLVLTAAMGFTCTQMVRHRELVAVLASGQSLHRVFRPVLLVAIGLTFLQALNQELLIPRVAHLLLRDQGDAGRKAMGVTEVPLTADGRGRLWYARQFDADAEILRGLHVIECDERGLALRVIKAQAANWSGSGWSLQGVTVEGRQERVEPGTLVQLIETDLDPLAIKIRRYEGFSQSLSWGQIGQMIDVIERPAWSEAAHDLPTDAAADAHSRVQRLERIRWGRVSVMLSNVLALAITLPFFATRMPQSMILQSLKCTPIALVSLLGAVLGSSVPVPMVPAQAAVFLPVAILLPVAIASATSMKT